MEANGEIKISPKYSKEEYLNLKLSIRSDESKWSKAIDIFKDRIIGRYFNQIDLLSYDINSNGFTIMALNCLLIESLFQFRDGVDKTPGKNSQAYPRFLEEAFPHVFDSSSKANMFYHSVRCGILHSAQTKDGARLSDDSSFVIRLDNNVLVVSVLGLTNELRKYLNNYVIKLGGSAETKLRNAFIKKMSYICRT